MANFDSDYEIRLATLQALGGDTTRHYDSVYSIDLEILSIIEGGGGGGMDYDAIKSALAASGVTEILFTGNGSGETVTLDYNLVSQIGQGDDYICVNTIDELSGITSPKDGMIAYVAGKGMWKYNAATGVTKWLMFDVDFDTLTAAEIDTMCADYFTYRNELKIRKIKSDEYDNRHIWFLTPGQFYGDGWLSFISTISRTPGDRQQVLKMIFRKENGAWFYNQDETAVLELYTKGKSENDIYNDVKTKLLNTGVQGIKFVDGGNTKTIDYDAANHIPNKYIVVMTEAEYEALTTKDENTIYYLTSN